MKFKLRTVASEIIFTKAASQMEHKLRLTTKTHTKHQEEERRSVKGRRSWSKTVQVGRLTQTDRQPGGAIEAAGVECKHKMMDREKKTGRTTKVAKLSQHLF